jgi:hypothetical protein
MTPKDLRSRREALGLSQSQLGAMLWEKPQSGRVTVVSLESGQDTDLEADGRVAQPGARPSGETACQ